MMIFLNSDDLIYNYVVLPLCQEKELLDNIENILSNEPAVVKRGHHSIEVNPQVSTSYILVFV